MKIVNIQYGWVRFPMDQKGSIMVKTYNMFDNLTVFIVHRNKILIGDLFIYVFINLLSIFNISLNFEKLIRLG